MRADAAAATVLAVAPLAVMLADARAPAVLAGAPDAVMLADARAPAVLAFAPLAVMLADASLDRETGPKFRLVSICSVSKLRVRSL